MRWSSNKGVVVVDKTTGSERKSQRLPDADKEMEIRVLMHHVQTHYKHGQYHEALKSGESLLEATLDHFGKDHPATASAHNNIALMAKHLGDYGTSKKHYYESLRVYARTVGKDHASYAAALHNTGNLSRTQAHMDESLSAMQRMQLMEEAVEYLEDAYMIRKAELGKEHPHTVASRSNLGSTMASQVLQRGKSSSTTTTNRLTKQRWLAAEDHLRQALETAVENPRGEMVRESSVPTLSAATAAQNLAVFLKSKAMGMDDKEETLAEAKQWYEKVLVVRQELLPHASHPDLVATKHSLAELLSAVGDEEGANKLRNEIMDSYQVTESENESTEK